MGGRKVNADGDGPDENNKAEAEPPTVTENPLHNRGSPNHRSHRLNGCTNTPFLLDFSSEI
ncbi:hypothetical protein T06_15935 [Trichinella sp. T6]|nr:hypothetical protein T06_15935 [Trichinella sp. T6]